MQGEDQKKLDILANEVFLNMLAKSGQCAVVVSMFVPSQWYQFVANYQYNDLTYHLWERYCNQPYVQYVANPNSHA